MQSQSDNSEVFIGLGSNLGNRAVYLAAAIEQLVSAGLVLLKASAVYETAPWGMSQQPNYLNMVIQVQAASSAQDLLRLTQQIESAMGRIRHEKWAARIIDIDLLYFGRYQSKTVGLVLPHPALHERRFVLVPLNDIAPDFIHPFLQSTQAALLKDCSDVLPVWRVANSIQELLETSKCVV